MTRETTDKLLDYLIAHKERFHSYVLMGGEPLLSKDLVLEFIHKLNNDDIENFLIMTNGTLPIKLIDENLSSDERSKTVYNISVKNIKESLPKNIEENIEYAKIHNCKITLLTVNTPENIHKLTHFVKLLKRYAVSTGGILRQHMMGDIWKDEDIEEYKKVLPYILHRALYYEEIMPGFKLFVPGKPDYEISESDMSQEKYHVNIVDQDSICNYVVIGIDGKVYLCDAACGAGDHSYGYIWEERKNPWIREFGYQDILYDYCERAKKKICPEFDRENDKWRKKWKKIKNLLLILKKARGHYDK